jgi:hypothetical protein
MVSGMSWHYRDTAMMTELDWTPMDVSVKRPAPVSVIPAAMRRRGPHALAALPAIRDVKKKVIDSGSSAMPARTAGSPRTSCRNSGNTNNSPYMPKVISVALARLAEKAG